MKKNKMKAILLGLLAVTMSSQIMASTAGAASASTNSGSNSYIETGGTDSASYSMQSTASTPVAYASSSSASSKVEKVIKVGMSYLGTPYEYGSNRNSTKTFDCSDFVRHAYKKAIGVTLPADSRKQGAWIRSNSTAKYSMSSLKRGDLVFFGKYRGSSKSAYKKVNKKTERITHVGIYLGNGKILHTYSKKSGGVRTNSIKNNSWEYRFLFGGTVVK